MKLQIYPDLNTINWSEIAALYDEVEWGTRDPQELKKAFEKSAFTCFIRKGEMIIGFGRTVDDGKYYAMLADVVVKPEYQGKGLGTQIVTTLKDQLQGYKFITLTAAPHKGGFYEKLGWKKQKSAFIMPQNENQIKFHCE